MTITLAAKKFAIKTDPRLDRIRLLLPGLNCGVCGFSSCGRFSQALIDSTARPGQCIPAGIKTTGEIADILGIENSQPEPRMAVIHCQGGLKEASDRCTYLGIVDCNAAVMAGNGAKVCGDGCLGLGTCVGACPVNAISITDNGVAAVNAEKCTGCGKCCQVCPRQLIELIPKVHKIFLACNNHERGTKVKKYCTVGCTSCTLCVKATPSGAISMENNLPKLDYAKNENFICAAQRCPSHCFIDLIKIRPKANIDMKCTGCGECLLVCPVKEAISGEIGSRFVIDKNKCIGCGICLEKCKAHAISLWGSLGFTQAEKSRRIRTPIRT